MSDSDYPEGFWDEVKRIGREMAEKEAKKQRFVSHEWRDMIEYLAALDHCIAILPKTLPEPMEEELLKQARRKAMVLRNRLEY